MKCFFAAVDLMVTAKSKEMLVLLAVHMVNSLMKLGKNLICELIMKSQNLCEYKKKTTFENHYEIPGSSNAEQFKYLGSELRNT